MKYGFYVLITFFVLSCSNPEIEAPPIEGTIGDSAMVVTAHPLATKVGLDVLKKGGNAFDAAFAIKFTLAVVYPVAGNIGGGGFAVFKTEDGSYGSLDFREKAPLEAHKDMYLDSLGNVVPNKSTLGHMAAGVPGTVAGIFALHEKYGTLPYKELIEPAIKHAQSGVVLQQFDVNNINKYQHEFRTVNRDSIHFLKNGEWQSGDTLFHQDLARSLIHIQELGKEAFYEGPIADLIVEENKMGGGLIGYNDLKNYQPQWREPLISDYKGHIIIAMPPPSSGGVAIVQLLKSAEEFDLEKLDHNSAPYIHILTELERRVYADRATYLGDPDYFDVPVEMLISSAYNKDRVSDIDLEKATSSQDIKEGNVEIIESIETTHFSIIDKWGNAVSLTTTLNSYFGCKVMVSGAGFFLNNEMDDFSAKPGVPNLFGLVGAEANAIHPEKRMLSSMTPTILEKDGRVKLILGTPGGSTIITSVFQTALNVLDHNMTLQQAVNAPKLHHQWLPDRILYERSTLDSLILNQLAQYGHTVEERGEIGRLQCIYVREDGKIEGASDRRGYGAAMGY